MKEFILQGLNESQRAAVTAPLGPVLVIAGPGTGKTLTITRRIAYLISEGVKSENIFAITFTNRAAAELRLRIRDFVKDHENLFAGTFHLLALKIIKESYNERFSIINRQQQMEILKDFVKPKEAENVLERISRIKNLIEGLKTNFEDIFYTYQKRLSEKKFFDFDDLILKAIEILSGEGDIRWNGRTDVVIVDEYQDINPLQYRFLRLLVSENIYAVGDPDQSIYSFRGANVENFLNFEKDYPGARRFVLDTNYRSQSIIVEASESLIRHNKQRMPRTVRSLHGGYYPVRIVSVPDEFGEREFIVKSIEGRLGGMDMIKSGSSLHRTDVSLSDFAILLRTNSQVFGIESALKEKGIPCYIMGRLVDEEIRDAISYVEQNMALPLSGLILTLKERFSFFRLLSNEYEPVSTEDLHNWLRLISPQDEQSCAEGAKILTLHMAKGLEFRVVFIPCLEEGLLPYNPDGPEEDIEEERRLLYVGMTRAKEELFLIHARKRKLYGKIAKQHPSRFLSEIPEVFTEEIFIPEKIKKRQIELF